MRYLAAVLLMACVSSAYADDDYEQLFNGKNLEGWDGDPAIWSVENGVIVGQTQNGQKLERNTFLVWTDGEVGDFEARVVFRLEGDNNSGVQYRSRLAPKNGKWSVVGYQADIHPAGNYAGMLYDEGGRGIAAEHGQRVAFAADGKKSVDGEAVDAKRTVDFSDWSTIEIKAIGNKLVHTLNGDVTVEVTDDDAKEAEARGILALQVHAGPPMRVEFKSVELKRLGEGAAAKK